MKRWKQLRQSYLRWKRRFKYRYAVPGVTITETPILPTSTYGRTFVLPPSTRKGPIQLPVQVRSKWHFQAFMEDREVVRYLESGHLVYFDPKRGAYKSVGLPAPGYHLRMQDIDYAEFEKRWLKRLGIGIPKSFEEAYNAQPDIMFHVERKQK